MRGLSRGSGRCRFPGGRCGEQSASVPPGASSPQRGVAPAALRGLQPRVTPQRTGGCHGWGVTHPGGAHEGRPLIPSGTAAGGLSPGGRGPALRSGSAADTPPHRRGAFGAAEVPVRRTRSPFRSGPAAAATVRPRSGHRPRIAAIPGAGAPRGPSPPSGLHARLCGEGGTGGAGPWGGTGRPALAPGPPAPELPRGWPVIRGGSVMPEYGQPWPRPVRERRP